MKPWELHPALVHFPIAFLVGGLALDYAAAWKKRDAWLRPAAGLLVWGVITGWLAALAGLLAWYTLRNDEGMNLWHPVTAALSMIAFTALAVVRWRRRATFATPSSEGLGAVAALLILAAGYIGSHMVYRAGMGVEGARVDRAADRRSP
jgi:uncharacterized membrane protein